MLLAANRVWGTQRQSFLAKRLRILHPESSDTNFAFLYDIDVQQSEIAPAKTVVLATPIYVALSD